MTKELIAKLRDGDSLTNDEIEQLYSFYKNLQESTLLLGERYNLMWVDMYSNQVRLQGYMVSRGMDLDLPL